MNLIKISLYEKKKHDNQRTLSNIWSIYSEDHGYTPSGDRYAWDETWSLTVDEFDFEWVIGSNTLYDKRHTQYLYKSKNDL